MHDYHIEAWQHDHLYLPAAHACGERRTRRVIALTAVMMVAEIVVGTMSNSMALLADGWHMASHASALGITAWAYAHARRHAADARYSFGTWKVGVLGGFSSAVVLGLIAAMIGWESIGRLREPLVISFDEAILVAALGLVVNLVSAYMLDAGEHQHDHDHPHQPSPGSPASALAGGHAHDRHDHASDHNLRAAYTHVIADALTSVCAIVALLAGKLFGWVWMDPMMGIVGAVVIGRWSFVLIRDSALVLLDAEVDPQVADRLRTAIEREGDNRVVDLHVWRVGPSELAAIISVATHDPQPPDHYKGLVAGEPHLEHVAVEVNRCPGGECGPEVAGA